MEAFIDMKKLILVTSPPACGKTFISKQVAKALHNCVYLDKDTLIVLSKQIFVVAGQEYNRSSDFFQKEIRDYEYYCVLDLAFEALDTMIQFSSMLRLQRRSEMMSILTIFALSLQRKMQSSSLSG